MEGAYRFFRLKDEKKKKKKKKKKKRKEKTNRYHQGTVNTAVFYLLNSPTVAAPPNDMSERIISPREVSITSAEYIYLVACHLSFTLYLWPEVFQVCLQKIFCLINLWLI